MGPEATRTLTQLARSRSVPWLFLAEQANPTREMDVLSSGAIEYLVTGGEHTAVSKARLTRILTDRFRLQQQLPMSATDPLTKLPTRRVFLQRMEAEWRRAEESQSIVSLVLINLSKFKSYNREHGYLSGDNVLKTLANQLKSLFGGSGQILARFGGSEFSLLLPGTSPEEARLIGKRIRTVVLETGIVHRGPRGEHPLTARVGVHSVVPGTETSLYLLIVAAEADLRRHSGA